MSKLWMCPDINTLGGQTIKREWIIDDMPDNMITYVPGMKKDVADIIFPIWGDIGSYIKQGNDPKRCIPHFLSFDNGVIEPMWQKHLLKKRIEKMQGLGIDKVVAPDFSSWANWPIALQIWNYFRSNLVTVDFGAAGIKILPNVCWSIPELYDLSFSMWPDDMPVALIDLNHVGKKKDVSTYNMEHARNGLKQCKERWPKTKWVVYLGNNSTKHIIAETLGRDVLYIRSRVFMLMRLKDAHKRLEKKGGDVHEKDD